MITALGIVSAIIGLAGLVIRYKLMRGKTYKDDRQEKIEANKEATDARIDDWIDRQR